MAKKCPFLGQDCVESDCMLWIAADASNGACAVAAIAGFLGEIKSKPAVQINNEQNITN